MKKVLFRLSQDGDCCWVKIVIAVWNMKRKSTDLDWRQATEKQVERIILELPQPETDRDLTLCGNWIDQLYLNSGT